VVCTVADLSVGGGEEKKEKEREQESASEKNDEGRENERLSR